MCVKVTVFALVVLAFLAGDGCFQAMLLSAFLKVAELLVFVL